METFSTPPPGRDRNWSATLITVQIILVVVAGLFVTLRCYIRLLISGSFGWDDVSIIVALVFSIAGAVFQIIIFQNGVGRHLYYLPDPKTQLPMVLKFTTIYTITNVVGTNMVRISMLIFILRIQNSKRLKHMIWAMMTLNSMVTIATFATLAAQCIPLQRFWDPSVPGTCLPTGSAYIGSYVQSSFAIMTDLFCTASPIIILWGVQISRRRKIAICGLISLGLIATVCNAIRNFYIPALTAPDFTYDLIPIVTVSNLEYYLGIAAACLPIFMPVFNKAFILKCWSRLPKVSRIGRFTGTDTVRPIKPRNLDAPIVQRIGYNISNIHSARRRSSESIIPLHDITGKPGIICSTTYKVEYGVHDTTHEG